MLCTFTVITRAPSVLSHQKHRTLSSHVTEIQQRMNNKADTPVPCLVSLCLTECVLSCQREVEDDVDSYQVPSHSLLWLLRPLQHEGGPADCVSVSRACC